MATESTPERHKRARRMADEAPAEKPSSLRPVSDDALAWGVDGPQELRRLLRASADLVGMIRRTDSEIREAQQRQQQAIVKLTDALDRVTYPLLSELAETVIDSDDLDVDSGAAVAASLLAERTRLQEEIAVAERDLTDMPKQRDKQWHQLEARKAEVQAQLNQLQREGDALTDDLLSTSAEQQAVELHYANARRRLNQLNATVKVVLAHVEQQDGPVAASRLYHEFRETTHFRSYRREAEEALAKLDERTRAFNDLVEDYNALLARAENLEAEAADRNQALDHAWGQVDELHAELDTLRTEHDKAARAARAAKVLGTPVNEVLPADVHNPLIIEGLLTCRQVVQCTRQQLLAINGLGPNRVDHIEKKLAQVGLHLRG